MIKEIYRAFLSCDQNITSDTRKISPNCIFFALKGPNFNGNNFVSEAIHKGASYAVIDDERLELDKESVKRRTTVIAATMISFRP